MAIIAALKIHDGLVLAADSAVHIYQDLGNANHRRVKTYTNGQNLFRVRELKVGILTYGLGNIGNRSIASLVNEFIRTKGVNFTEVITVQDIAQSLFYTIKEKYEQFFGVVPLAERPPLGFMVCGFSKTDLIAQEFEFALPHSIGVKRVKEPSVYGFECRGFTRPFERLHRGYDKNMILELAQKFELSETMINEVVNKYESSVIYSGMPVAEGVEYVKHTVLTAINHGRFETGEPPCSEPIDIVVITRDKYTEVQTKLVN